MRVRAFEKQRSGVVVLCVALLAAFSAVCGSCRKSGLHEREVVLYCSVDREAAEPLLTEFEKRTGIRVLASYDSEDRKIAGLTGRLVAEKDSPAADVFWTGEVFHIISLSRKGLLAPYHDARTGDWPARFADAGGLWYGFACRARVIAYSTKRLRPQDAPTKLEDLLDPKWKGRIAMANPVFGTTRGEVASWFRITGPNARRRFCAA